MHVRGSLALNIRVVEELYSEGGGIKKVNSILKGTLKILKTPTLHASNTWV